MTSARPRESWQRLAGRVAVGYAALAAASIFISDRLLTLAPGRSGVMLAWQTAKGWLFVGVTTVLLWLLLRRLLRRLAAAADGLAESERRLHALATQTLRLQDEERRRIARDLHDTTAQNLAALQMNLAMLEQGLPADAASLRALVADCQSLTDRSAQEIRTLSHLLHPPLLEELGLARAVRDYAEGFSQRSGIRVEVDVDETLGRLDRESELALFRALQESLGNVHRHSGSALARVRLGRRDDGVCLEVEDEGRGLPADVAAGQRPGGVGLLGMRERLRDLGGELEVTSGLPGVRLRATLPLRRGSV